MFENPEIALEDLPAIEKLDWQTLDSRFVRRLLVERLVVVLLVTVASVIPGILLGDKFAPPVPLWLFAILFAIPFMAWPFISVPKRGYVVRDKDIVFKFGVVFRSVTAVPFNRIQHVETSSTPLDRKFDIAALQIFTAGGSGGDLKIEGLGADVAERLRIYILEKVGASVENA